MKNNYMRILFLMIILPLFLFGCQKNNVEVKIPVRTTKQTIQDIQSDGIITAESIGGIPSDKIKYLGAFQLPYDGTKEKEMFSWGGEAIAYNESNHSLFYVGHAWHTFISEVSIPQPIVSKNLDELNRSQIIQAFKDIKGKQFRSWGMEIPRVGIEVLNDHLYFCFGEHYEENTTLGTHGFTDLALNSTKKTCIVGDYLYSTNDYIFKIPTALQIEFKGNDLVTGRFRDGGWSGMGPSLFVINSNEIVNAENKERISTTPLLLYDSSYQGDNGAKMTDYSHADSITGGAFIACDAGNSVIFAATHGYGETWYGFSNGVVYPTDSGENVVYPDVPPYPHDERGWWNDDFRASLIMYDVEHLIEAMSGEVLPSEVQPTAIIDLDEYMLVDRDETDMQYLGGCAYDNNQNRLYVLELFADNDQPIVHVFTFE